MLCPQIGAHVLYYFKYGNMIYRYNNNNNVLGLKANMIRLITAPL